jgi:hypothetical protein
LGADINAKCEIGTPLHLATIGRHPQAVKLLLALGANPNGQLQGSTPKGLARSSDALHGILGQTPDNIKMEGKLTKYTASCGTCQNKGAEVNLSTCARCGKAYYCSAACQKQDWKQHKKTCSADAKA